MKSPTDKRFAVLIAAYNEAELIYDTVIAASLVPRVAGVIVVDDGSKDATAEEAKRAGAIVLSQKHNRGKGAAMELAVASLLELKPFGLLSGVVLLDGDLGKSAKAAVELLEPLLDNSADLVIGVLPSPQKKAGFGWTKKLAFEGIQVFGNGFESRAPLSGQRALTLDCLNKVRPFAEGYALEVDMTVKALQHKQRVMEVAVDMEHRYSKRNLKGFLHRWRQFDDINRLLNSYYKRKRS